MGAGIPVITVDAAVHVWSDADGPYPWPQGAGNHPDVRPNAETLFSTLAGAGIDGAVCVQPRAYGYDHRYLVDVKARWPDRVAGVGLVDPLSASVAQDMDGLIGRDRLSG